jgi:excinuclease ABC subunit B
MGRAARNIDGRVLLYADHVSSAMRSAIDETNRRRRYQIEYNEEQNVTPQSIKKEIKDIAQSMPVKLTKKQTKVTDYDPVEVDELTDYILELEEQMKESARNLEFEKAAALRDKIAGLRKQIEDFQK